MLGESDRDSSMYRFGEYGYRAGLSVAIYRHILRSRSKTAHDTVVVTQIKKSRCSREQGRTCSKEG